MSETPQRAQTQVAIDEKDPLGSLVVAVMNALQPICRDPLNPTSFDGNRAVDALGAAAAMIFAGIPEPFREEQVESWIKFVREASVRIETGRYHTIKVAPRA